MARYIDIDKLIAEYDRVHIGPPGGARKLMEEAPTADVVEVRHGRYITNDDGDSHCSICGELWLNSTHNYCPNCGAKMDGKEDA